MSNGVKPESIPTSSKPKHKLTYEQKEAEKSKRGRPSIYKPEYCDMLINHMREGYSFKSFAGVIEVSFECIYEWERVYPEFSDAKRIGIALQLRYDEKLLDELSKGHHGKSASSATHIFKMKNCHKWTDKQEIEQTVREIKIDIDSDDTAL